MKSLCVAFVTNSIRLPLIKKSLKSLIDTCKNKDNVMFLIFENGDFTKGVDIEFELQKIVPNNINIQFCRTSKRIGLAPAWNLCIKYAKAQGYDWTLLCNDDIESNVDFWDDAIHDIMAVIKREVYTFCYPNGFSAFLVHQPLVERVGWFRDEFPAGYWEDDDFFLKIAVYYGLHTKTEVMDKIVFSYFDNFGTMIFQHRPVGQENEKYLGKWNGNENKVIFDKYWQEVTGGIKNCYEAKSGRFYIKL